MGVCCPSVCAEQHVNQQSPSTIISQARLPITTQEIAIQTLPEAVPITEEKKEHQVPIVEAKKEPEVLIVEAKKEPEVPVGEAKKEPEVNVEQAKKESEVIVEQAKKESEVIVEQAKKESEVIVELAKKESEVLIVEAKKESEVLIVEAKKESEVIVDQAKKESEVIVEQEKKESEVIVEQAKKESEVIVEQAKKESEVIVEQAKKESGLIVEEAKKESEVIVQDAKKESEVIVDQAKKESEVIVEQAKKESEVIVEEEKEPEVIVKEEKEPEEEIVEETKDTEEEIVVEKKFEGSEIQEDFYQATKVEDSAICTTFSMPNEQMNPQAKKLMADPTLHSIAQAICRGDNVNEEDLKALPNVDSCELDGVYHLDENFSVQILPECSGDDSDESQVRSVDSQHRNAIKIHAQTLSEQKRRILLIERAKSGDLKAHYEKLIEAHKDDQESDFEYGSFKVKSILSWRVVSSNRRLFLIQQLSSALANAVPKNLKMLNKDLEPHNIKIRANHNIKLVTLGNPHVTQDQEGNDVAPEEPACFSWSQSEINARNAPNDEAAQVYAFGQDAVYIMFGVDLSNKNDKKMYLDNKAKSKVDDHDWLLLKGTINWCMSKNPLERPTFVVLEKEIFYRNLDSLCRKKTDESDMRAVYLINHYGTVALLNYQDKDNQRTCLMRACLYRRLAVVKCLLHNGADPNHASEIGTALHEAACFGFLYCAQMLVEDYDINLNIQNSTGWTALDYAIDRKKTEVGVYLKSKGAICKERKYPKEWKDVMVPKPLKRNQTM